MKILASYDRLKIALVEKNGSFYVVDRQEQKVLFRGDEKTCTKEFIMLVTQFIEM